MAVWLVIQMELVVLQYSGYLTFLVLGAFGFRDLELHRCGIHGDGGRRAATLCFRHSHRVILDNRNF